MSCKFNETCIEELEENDYSIIQKCIAEILETKEGKSINSYIVNPYLDQVSFTPYSKEEIEKAFKTLEISFEKVISMNEKFSNCQKRYYESLSSLSNNSSSIVFSTTILYEDLIQIKLIDYYGEIDNNKIKNGINLNPSSIYEYIFKINKEADVKILLQSATFYD